MEDYEARCDEMIRLNDIDMLIKNIDNGLIKLDDRNSHYLLRKSAANGNLEYVKYLLPFYNTVAYPAALYHAIRRGKSDIFHYMIDNNFIWRKTWYVRAYSIAVEEKNIYLMDEIIGTVPLSEIIIVIASALAITVKKYDAGDDIFSHLFRHAGRRNWRETLDRALLYTNISAKAFDKLLSYGADIGYDHYECTRKKYTNADNGKIKARINVLARCE